MLTKLVENLNKALIDEKQNLINAQKEKKALTLEQKKVYVVSRSISKSLWVS